MVDYLVIASCSVEELASFSGLAGLKLGWLVEDRSLAHILSVVITMFGFSMMCCTETYNMFEHCFKVRKK